MVRKSLQFNEKTTSTLEDEQEFAKITNSPGRSSPDVAKTEPSRLPLIRKSLEQYKLSSSAKDILMASWRSGTTKQYQTCLTKWQAFCNEHKLDTFAPGIENAIEFLVSLYNSGLGYSAINTACSALSTVLILQNGRKFGKHP